jgi:hypothetical protein
MRLTLRTLLAWLDDTLPASEVRQIGKQVAESPFAQELVDRTYRVTRQRRLLVPSSSGPEATDASLVAAYLDNELPPEEVAEYEKKCLTSDVNLAEVASVHQILSLIGQKAKVPAESRHRMYRLVKGRESVMNMSAKVFRTVPVVADAPPSPPAWSPPAAVQRPIGERLGIASLVAVLIAVIGWTAYSSLRPEAGSDADHPTFRPPLAKGGQVPPPVVEGTPDATTKKAMPEPVAKVASTEPKAATPPDTTKPGVELKPATPITLVPGEGVAVGWNREKGEWTRLTAASPIKDGTRLLNLAPFWTTFQTNNVQVLLVGEAETTINDGGQTSGVRLGFVQGRAVLKGGDVGSPYRIVTGAQTVSVANAPGTAIGVERGWSLPVGADAVLPAVLLIYVPEGEATLEVGAAKETIKGPAVVTLGDKGELKTLAGRPIPAWVTEAGPSPAEKQLGDRFLKFFSPSGSVLRDLVQAVDGDDQDVRRLAIRGLGAVGDAEMIVPVLNNASTDPATRRAAADVLRSMIARGGDSAKGVQTELNKVFGQEWADDMEKMLIGFTSDKEKRDTTLVELVRLLSSPELGTREMAIQLLMAITKRDNLEYDPIKPEGKGLKAWQELLHKREPAKPAATPAAPR